MKNERDPSDTIDSEEPKDSAALHAHTKIAPVIRSENENTRVSVTKPSDDAGAIDYLVEHQLRILAMMTPWAGEERRAKLERGVHGLYRSLAPVDGIDVMTASVMVGIHSLTMSSMERATPGSQGTPREVAMRYAIKGAKTLAELGEFYDARRGRGPRKVNVGTVNVEQGGKAIVGNVETTSKAKRRDKRSSDEDF